MELGLQDEAGPGPCSLAALCGHFLLRGSHSYHFLCPFSKGSLRLALKARGVSGSGWKAVPPDQTTGLSPCLWTAALIHPPSSGPLSQAGRIWRWQGPDGSSTQGE